MIAADWTRSPSWIALGWTVVHFLWQGALVGALAAVALAALRRRSSEARYAVAAGALLACLVAFVATFLFVRAGLRPGAQDLDSLFAGAGLAAFTGAASGADALGLAAWAWVLGASCMALRFGLCGLGARRLKTVDVASPGAAWERTFRELAEELGVTRAVRLLRSGLAEVPMVVGWLSPVVLVPASAFTALSPDELRSLLAHELAHVRRHDHLLNAAQAVVEVLLFFHPAVWWLSSQVRAEREYCCDDASLRLVGNRRLLAEALAAMERLRISSSPNPATRTVHVLAANGGPLMKRITRILRTQTDTRTAHTAPQFSAGLLLAGLLALGGTAWAASRPAPDGGEARVTVEHEDLFARGQATAEKLEAAVAAGELTREEADRKLQALHQHLQYVRFAREVEAGVAAGELTREAADEKLAAYREELDLHTKQEELEKQMRAISHALKTGTITPEEAKQKLRALEQRRGHALHQRQPLDFEAAIRKVEAAVEAGEMTPEEGRKMLAHLEELRAAQEAERDLCDPEGFLLRVKAAVEAGELTPAEGQAKLDEFHLRLEKWRVERERQAREESEQVLHAEEDVEELTPEEARERLHRHLMKLVTGDLERGTVTLEEVLTHVKEAVASGELSAEEAAKVSAVLRKLHEVKERADEARAEGAR